MIKVQNLTFAYNKQSSNTIKNISFEIGKAEIYGFLGPSGAGKSTTQKILTRILHGYNGKVQIMGHELKNCNNSF